jgi:para-nitrobenzyl esterase
MAAPSAQGLFQKAIGESGGALTHGGRGASSLAEVGAKDEAWLNTLGAHSLAEMRAIPAE